MFAVALLIFMFGRAAAEEQIGVCELLRSAKVLDGRIVTVTGLVKADQHLKGLVENGCSGGVVMIYAVDRMPPEFVAAITDKRLRLDLRPLKVSVRGRFKSHVPGQLGYTSQIEVRQALSWEFIGEKSAAPPPMVTPEQH